MNVLGVESRVRCSFKNLVAFSTAEHLLIVTLAYKMGDEIFTYFTLVVLFCMSFRQVMAKNAGSA